VSGQNTAGLHVVTGVRRMGLVVVVVVVLLQSLELLLPQLFTS
jgi:hypothetical protein